MGDGEDQDALNGMRDDIKKLENGLDALRSIYQNGKVFEVYKSGMACNEVVKAALLVLVPRIASCQERYSCRF